MTEQYFAYEYHFDGTKHLYCATTIPELEKRLVDRKSDRGQITEIFHTHTQENFAFAIDNKKVLRIIK